MRMMRLVILAACFGTTSAVAQQSNLSADNMAVILGTFVTQQRLCPLKSTADYPLGAEVAKLGHNIADFMPGGRYAQLMDVRVEKAVEFVKIHGLENACKGYQEYLIKYLPTLYEAPKSIPKPKT